MMNYNFDEETIRLVEKFIQIRNKGYYADSKQLQEVYNKVFDKKMQPTNCGSCIRGRITELEKALNEYNKQNKPTIEALESVSEAEPTTTKPEVRKAAISKTTKKRKE